MVIVETGLGPYHYEVIGPNEKQAAAEFQKFINFCERDVFTRGDWISQDIAEKRQELEAKYAVEIRIP